MSILALAASVLLSGQTTSAPAPRSGSDLTRDLNSAPPSAVQPQRPAPVQGTPVQTPAQTSPVAQSPAPRAPVAAAPTSTPRTQPPAARTPATTPSRPPVQATPNRATPAQTPRAQTPRAQTPTPTPAQTPTQTPAQVQTPQTVAETPVASPAAPPTALTAAAIAALPFRLDLPSDTVMTASRAGADANVYAVRRGDRALLMIYAGPASQFPIFDGQMVQTGGRASVVVTEGGRRLAMEHLFQRATAPTEIHVWVASPDGADRDLAERIGQSVDVR